MQLKSRNRINKYYNTRTVLFNPNFAALCLCFDLTQRRKLKKLNSTASVQGVVAAEDSICSCKKWPTYIQVPTRRSINYSTSTASCNHTSTKIFVQVLCTLVPSICSLPYLQKMANVHTTTVLPLPAVTTRSINYSALQFSPLHLQSPQSAVAKNGQRTYRCLPEA